MIDAKILIIDDNEAVRKTLRLVLGTVFSKVVTLANPQLIPALIKQGDIDVVLLDMNFGAGQLNGKQGLFWLEYIKTSCLPIPPSVVLITAFGDVSLAVASLKSGADDFVQKPWDNEKLIEILSEACQKHREAQMSISVKVEDEEKTACEIIIHSLIKKYAASYARPLTKLTTNALQFLLNLCKQGNFNQVQETIERTTLLSNKSLWDVNDLILSKKSTGQNTLTLEDLEKQFISLVLQETRHNLLLSAQQLGISRQTLYNKMKKYDIC